MHNKFFINSLWECSMECADSCQHCIHAEFSDTTSSGRNAGMLLDLSTKWDKWASTSYE